MKKVFTLLLLIALFCAKSWGQVTKVYNPSASAQTFTVPSGITSFTVECWGGGGAGGGVTGSGSSAGGGEGGAYVKYNFTSVTSGTSYIVTVGAGGTGSITKGGDGASSWFGSATTLLAVGGTGAVGVSANSAAGAGAGSPTPKTGNIVPTGGISFYGGNGGTAPSAGASGGGGGSAGAGVGATPGTGGNATGSTAGAAGSGGGAAGAAGRSSNGNGSSGSVPGGGGAGASVNGSASKTGGAGGDGRIIVSYNCPANIITSQPTGNSYCQSATPSALSVVATGENLSYQWYKNTTNNTSTGSQISNATSLTYLPSTANTGTIYYYVTVTGSCGSATSSTAAITVNANPTASASSNTPVCLGSTLNLTGITNGTTFAWTGPNSFTSSVQNPSISNTTASATGTYNFTATANGCSTTATTSVVINTLDNLQISAAPSSVCQGSGTSIIVSGGTVNNTVFYTVDNGSQQSAVILSGGNATINTPSYNAPGSSTYNLVSESNTSGCIVNKSGSATVTINPLPIVNSITGRAYVPVEKTDNLSETVTGGTWSIDNSTYATLNSTTAIPVSVTGVAVGTPTVTYTTAKNGNGCQNTTSLTLTVYDASIAKYRTAANGNFSNAAKWEVFLNSNGGNWVPADNSPGANTNIEVRDNTILDADFTGSSTSAFVISTGTLTIQPNVTLSSAGAVNFNNKSVVVHSDATGTGSIGQMTQAIAGATAVTAERYIPVRPDATINRAGRSWRLLTSPVTSTTINAAWQEGKLWDGTGTLASTGYGTLITGQQQGSAANANSHGYDYWDFTKNAYSSIRYYSIPDNATSDLSGTWSPLPGNGLADVNDISAYPAYLLFVRGDRSQNSPPASGATTLRPTGTLQQTSVTTTVPGSKRLTLVGNPFASMVDFEQVYNHSQIGQNFYVWNANNNVYGAYDLIQRNGGNYTRIPAPFTSTPTQDNTYRFIESGQGFLVQPPAAGVNGSITIAEAAKTSAAKTAGTVFKESADRDKKLYVNLNLFNSDSTITLADGLLTRFDVAYSSNVDADDVQKASNIYENISISSHSSDLIVEALPNISKTDTIQLKLWNTSQRQYQLQLKAENFNSVASLTAYIQDSYLKTKQPINLSGGVTTINFAVNADNASSSLNRFSIVFWDSSLQALPVTLVNVKANLQNSGVNVAWTATNEVNLKGYTVERSTDGGKTFNSIAAVGAKNVSSSVSNYNVFDATPQKGDNLYRIKLEGNTGTVNYSAVIKVIIGNNSNGMQITLYPNPVADGKINLQLANLVGGKYLVSVYSDIGQKVYQKEITVAQNGSLQSEELKLGNGLAQGNYNLHITDSKGATIFVDKVVVARQ